MKENSDPQVDSAKKKSMFKRIKQIQDSVTAQISSHFEDLKNKMKKTLDKTEKQAYQKVNEAFIGILDSITSVSEITSYDSFKFQRKVAKITNALQKMPFTEALNKISQKFKLVFEGAKKQGIFQSFPQFSVEQDVVKYEQKIKIEGNDPIEKIIEVNGKILKISKKMANIEKHFLQKQVDFAMPLTVSKQSSNRNENQKKKNVLFLLHDQSISVYNEKLILHSVKSFQYDPNHCILGVQIGRHLFIAEKNKLTRIHANNFDEINVKIFDAEITALCPEAYQDGIALGINNNVVLVGLDSLEPFFMFQSHGPQSIVDIKKCGQHLVVCTESGVKIYKNLEIWGNFITPMAPLKLIPATQNQFIAVDKGCNFVYCKIYSEENPQGQKIQKKPINTNRSNQMVKSIGVGGSNIYGLSNSGLHLFLHSF